MSEFVNINGKSLTYEEAQEVNSFMVHYNVLRSWGYTHEDAIKHAKETGEAQSLESTAKREEK